MPDLNSLPPSRSPSTSRILSTAGNGTAASPPSPPSQPSHSPHSLAATAAFNAGARSTEHRRRSSARMHLNLSEPGTATNPEGGISPGLRASPGPMSGLERHGRMGDRDRAPSLGELHQELEQEQEGQVNRLLHMIRQQQAQIQQLQSSQASPHSAQQAIDDSTPTSERSLSLSHPQTSSQGAPPHTNPRSLSPFRAHSSLSRRSSYRSSRNNSPLIGPMSGTAHETSESRGSADFTLGQPARERDDAAFYTAETQMLNRENAMLRQRIRELERQLREPSQPSVAGAQPTASSQPPVADAAPS